MKHRVRINMSFGSEANAKSLMDFARGLVDKSVNIRESRPEAEISFCEREYCYHDEAQMRPREVQERVEIEKKPVEMTPEPIGG